MDASELAYFEELRKEIAVSFLKNHPNCNPDIKEWRGQDITDFQEDLMNKVKGRISEKWFYTHIKSSGSALPRIDMLNMLSAYAGYENWFHFKKEHGFVSEVPKPNDPVPSPPLTKPGIKKPGWKKPVLFILVLLLIAVSGMLALSGKEHRYRCSFVDIDGHTPIHRIIRIILLRNGESPVFAETNANGCLDLSEKGERLAFVINTPYIKPDTFTRILSKSLTEETLQLRTDDYSLMIHYFSQSSIKDWEKRRAQLRDMISEHARIIQVLSGNSGMELYSRDEFIDKLTLPLKSLKNLEILNVGYSGNQINELRFTQTESK